jgi:hypothetical protein
MPANCDKWCPILSQSTRYGETCQENDCAWWDSNIGKCAVLVIARNVEAVGKTLEWVGRSRQ